MKQYDREKILNMKGREVFFMEDDSGMYDGLCYVEINDGMSLGYKPLNESVPCALYFEGVKEDGTCGLVLTDSPEKRRLYPAIAKWDDKSVVIKSVAILEDENWFEAHEYIVEFEGENFVVSGENLKWDHLAYIYKDHFEVNSENVRILNNL
jgi:hypothetical protein